MMRPKIVIEDRLTAEEKNELSKKIALIPDTLSPLDKADAISAARQEAQKNHDKKTS